MTTYRETFDKHELVRITFEVEGAESEQQARDIVSQYQSMEPEGNGSITYLAAKGVTLTIDASVEDSDTEENDDGEWEDDDDA